MRTTVLAAAVLMTGCAGSGLPAAECSSKTGACSVAYYDGLIDAALRDGAVAVHFVANGDVDGAEVNQSPTGEPQDLDATLSAKAGDRHCFQWTKDSAADWNSDGATIGVRIAATCLTSIDETGAIAPWDVSINATLSGTNPYYPSLTAPR